MLDFTKGHDDIIYIYTCIQFLYLYLYLHACMHVCM